MTATEVDGAYVCYMLHVYVCVLDAEMPTLHGIANFKKSIPLSPRTVVSSIVKAGFRADGGRECSCDGP